MSLMKTGFLLIILYRYCDEYSALQGGSGGESIKRLASSASLRGLIKLQPGSFNLR